MNGMSKQALMWELQMHDALRAQTAAQQGACIPLKNPLKKPLEHPVSRRTLAPPGEVDVTIAVEGKDEVAR